MIWICFLIEAVQLSKYAMLRDRIHVMSLKLSGNHFPFLVTFKWTFVCALTVLYMNKYERPIKYITSAPCIQATLISKVLSDKGEGEGRIN